MGLDAVDHDANDFYVTARIPSTVKDTLEQAASLLGTPLNQFMVQASLRAAEEVIRREQSVNLSKRDVSTLFDYLEQSPSANAKLRAAAERHRDLTNPD
ncbi:MAG: DUF1778 domain-containing protein, partial [Gammaproteobacteria bacterium]